MTARQRQSSPRRASKRGAARTAHSATPQAVARWRFAVAAVALAGLALALAWRVVGLQVLPGETHGFEFLQNQGQARALRVEPIAAYRGVITDRNGEPLAVSTEVTTLWVDPRILVKSRDHWPQLAQALGVTVSELAARVERYSGKGFMYLARHLPPADAAQVLSLKVPGVEGRREYKRYYPAGQVAAHLVGFTNIDDSGQEGMELAYDEYLSGSPGSKRVEKDLKGRVIKDLGLIEAARPGKSLQLSIDLRLQYLAYRELKKAVQQNRASSGSLVMLDVATGEVLAMVNQPSYNPNDRASINVAATRNRAVTDPFEPGSPMKTLTVMAALESGRYTPHTRIDTAPGYIQVGAKRLHDPVNYGAIDVTRVLTKSSQVGATKIALNMEPEVVRDMFFRLGLGQATGSGFPGERSGILPSYNNWQPIVRANFAFGYGLSVTALQLAQAYSVIAAEGVKHPVSLLKLDHPPLAERVVSAELAREVVAMLETVVQPGGTGTRAAIEGYSVAGKTGTVHKVGEHGYDEDRYSALFAGIAPADAPRIVMAIVINEPSAGQHFGGQVAAPVFAAVAKGALRIMNEPPRIAARSKKQNSTLAVSNRRKHERAG